MNDPKTPKSPEDQLPQEVVAALRQRNVLQTDVPGSLEETILADARKHLSGIPQRIPAPARPRRLRWVAWSTGTLAAAMLLFALLPKSPDHTGTTVGNSSDALSASDASVAAAATGVVTRDIDGNGKINILDAFALARTMNAGDVTGIRWDQNSDGQLNQADINLVALTAVTL